MTTPRVTVPVEPTEAMIEAGNRALSPWTAPAMHAAEAYRAMLSAAPAPEGGAVHYGDPCIKCGVGHDNVPPGPCRGDGITISRERATEILDYLKKGSGPAGWPTTLWCEVQAFIANIEAALVTREEATADHISDTRQMVEAPAEAGGKGALALALEDLAVASEAVRRLLHNSKAHQSRAFDQAGVSFVSAINRAKLVLKDYDRLRAQSPAREEAPAETTDCKRCAGNGEIVTDWDEYLSPPKGAPADHATADCPDCDGIGKVEAPAEAGERCEKCDAGPAGNCGYYDCETPRETCPLRTQPPARDDAQPVARKVAEDLIDIVEGIGGIQHGTWRDEKGMRLKDTPAWVAFYVAARKNTHPAPDALRVAVEALDEISDAAQITRARHIARTTLDALQAGQKGGAA